MKRAARFILFVFTIATLVGCGGNGMKDSAAVSGKEEIVLKLGHTQRQSDLGHLGAQKFAELVEQKTGGEVKVRIFPGSALGNERDLAEGLQTRSVDFALLGGVLGDFESSLKIMELPYLFKDETHLSKIVYGEVGEEMLNRLLAASGIRGLSFWDSGSRQLTTNKPINLLDDIKGLKILVTDNSDSPMTAVWKAMGADPVPLARNEVTPSLRQNIVEALENTVPGIHDAKIYEVQKYIALTNHRYEYVIMAMSEKTWQKLTSRQQQAITEAAQEAAEYENKLVAGKTEELFRDLTAKGMKVTRPDTAGWAKAAQAVHREFIDKNGIEIYDKIIYTRE